MPIIQPNSGLTQAYGAQSQLKGAERNGFQEKINDVSEKKLEAAEKGESAKGGSVRVGESADVLSAGVTSTTDLANADKNLPRGSFLDVVV